MASPLYPMPTPSWLLPKVNSSPLAAFLGDPRQFLRDNSSTLIGLGAGIAGGGPDFGQAVSQGLSLAGQGQTADFNRIEKAKADAKLVANENATKAWLAKNRPDLANLPVDEAWQIAMKSPVSVGAGDSLVDPLTGKQVYSAPAAAPKPPDGFTFGPDGQTLTPIPGGPAALKAANDKFQNEQVLNQQYTGSDPVKTYNVVRTGYQKVRQSSQLKTGAGDVSMIFAYMKMLDPTSVVREGEFATAQNTAGIPQTVVNLYNQAISGVRLSDQQRKDFLDAADQIYGAATDNLGQINQQYTYRAGEQGIDPQTFVIQPQKFDPLQAGNVPNLMPGQSITTPDGVTITAK